MPSLLENTIKYGILAATSPIWWPIAKTLWAELQAALWREGGLIGREPTQREIPILRERYKEFSSPLINESLAEFKARENREEQVRLDEEKNPKGKRQKAQKSGGSAREGGQRTRSGGAIVRPGGGYKQGGVLRPAQANAKRKSNGSASRGSAGSASPRKPGSVSPTRKRPGF